MPTATIDGITTRYEVAGSGPPLLMFSPGGFDATVEKWSVLGSYAATKMMEQLPKHYTCIMFDRRECGVSGGRVERFSWAAFVAQGKGLLEHLKIERAHVMGGCMGCSPAAAFGAAHPDATLSMVLYWPVGGVKYRLSSHQRFADHLGYVQQHGLDGVVALVDSEGKGFGTDPRTGPWAAVIKSNRAFAESYKRLDADSYKTLVAGIARTMWDRDTAPGAEPEDLLRLEVPAFIVPGNDAAHATSAARYLHECLGKSEYWDALPAAQTETAAARLLGFLAGAA